VAEKLERVQNVVRHNLNDAWSASCKWYNRKVKPKSFDVGQTVRVYYPGRYRSRTRPVTKGGGQTQNPSATPAQGGDCPVAMPPNQSGGLLRKIELSVGCSVGFKYAKNALSAGAPPWTPLGELTLPQTSYSGVDGRGPRGHASQSMDKKIKTQLPHYAYRRACSCCH